MQSVTFSSTATALSDLTVVDMADGDPTFAGGYGGLRVFASSTATGGAATVEFVLVEKGVRLATFPATVTPSAYRANAAGTGGSYLCDVVFAEGGTSKLDLFGAYGRNGQIGPGLNGDDQGACWMVGCSSLGGTTALTLRLAKTVVV